MYFDYLQVLWSKYAAALDANAQKESIYKPLGEWFRAAFGVVFNFQSWSAAAWWLAMTITWPFEWYKANWRTLPGIFLTGMLGLASFLVYRGRPTLTRLVARRGRGSWRPRWAWPAARKARRSAGSRPVSPGADWCAWRVRRRSSLPWLPAASWPRTSSCYRSRRCRGVVEAFYRVRFGARPLDNSEAKAVEHALRTLEAKL